MAVFGGALGCLLLLLRKSVAYYLFMASLFGVVVTMTHTLGIFGPTIDFGLFEIMGIILMPLVVAAFFDLVFEEGREQGVDQLEYPFLSKD